MDRDGEAARCGVLQHRSQRGRRGVTGELFLPERRRVAGRHDHNGVASLEDGTGVGIADLFHRFAHHEFGFGEPTKLVAQHSGLARGRCRADEVGAGKLPRRVQCVERFGRTILVAQRFPNYVRRLDFGTHFERGARQPFGDRRLPERQRVAGGDSELFRPRAIAGIEPPQRDTEELRRGTVRCRLQSVRQLQLHVIASRRRHSVAEDFSEQRVRQRDIDAIAPARSDKAAPLQSSSQLDNAEMTQTIDRKRLTDRDDFERGTVVLVQVAHARCDDIRKPMARCQRASPLPQSLCAGKRAGLETVEEDLAQVQRVTAARRPEELQRRAFDCTVEHGGHNAVHLGASEALERDQRRRAVLPQRDDRVGRWFSAPECRDDARGAAAHEQRDERSRRVVEQVGVVDTEDESAAVSLALERADDAMQCAVAPASERAVGHEVRDRAERDRCRRVCGRNPFRLVIVGRSSGEDLVGEPRLPDTGGAGQHDAVVLGERGARQRELIVATDERPTARIDDGRPRRSAPSTHGCPSVPRRGGSVRRGHSSRHTLVGCPPTSSLPRSRASSTSRNGRACRTGVCAPPSFATPRRRRSASMTCSTSFGESNGRSVNTQQ